MRRLGTAFEDADLAGAIRIMPILMRRLSNTSSISNGAAFGALILAQAAHSVEEYVGRLWEVFPPAAFLTSLISADRELGFIVINCVLVSFGIWCYLWPIRGGRRSAAAVAWFWVILETVNGIVHSVWSFQQGGYTPGLITAPALLVLSLFLASRLRSTSGALAP